MGQRAEKRTGNRNETGGKAAGAVCAFLGVWACLESVKSGSAPALSNSALSVLLFALLMPVCLRAFREGAYPALTRLCGACGALFLGTAWFWGKQLDGNGNVDFLSAKTWLVPLAFAVSFGPVFSWLFSCGKKGGGQEDPARRGKSRAQGEKGFFLNDVWVRIGRRIVGHPIRFGAPGLFLAWLPVFLAVYPGFFAYDATDELNQVLSGEYVTRHPLIHVLLLGKTALWGEELTGSYNAGIAVYVLAQMAAMALLLSWAAGEIGTLCERSRWKSGIRAGTWLFFAFFPAISLYVLCTVKDTPYTAAMLAVILLLLRMEREPDRFWKDRKAQAGLAVALLCMALLRNNGFYIFLALIPILLVRAGRKRIRRMGCLLLLALLCYFGVNGGLKAALHPADTDVQETLTVPIQQLARVWKDSPETFSASDREALFEVLPAEALEYYTPKLSDPVKIGFDKEAFQENPGRYLGLWARIGLKAPFTYANAWLMTSYGFWYPDTVIDVYNGVRDYVDSSWFSFETEEPGVRNSLLPGLEEIYRKISLEIWVQRVPVLSMLFSPGFLCWVYVLGGTVPRFLPPVQNGCRFFASGFKLADCAAGAHLSGALRPDLLVRPAGAGGGMRRPGRGKRRGKESAGPSLSSCCQPLSKCAILLRIYRKNWKILSQKNGQEGWA